MTGHDVRLFTIHGNQGLLSFPRKRESSYTLKSENWIPALRHASAGITY